MCKNSKLLWAVALPKMEEDLFYLSGVVAWDPTFTTEAAFPLGSSVNMSFRQSWFLCYKGALKKMTPYTLVWNISWEEIIILISYFFDQHQNALLCKKL